MSRGAPTDDVDVLDEPFQLGGVRAVSTGSDSGRRVDPGVGLRRKIVVAGLCLALASVFGGGIVTSAGGPRVPGLTVGVTHTQYSVDSWGSSAAVARGRSVLESVAPVQNQHLMGWGAMNPEPSPGEYNFASLDRRIAAITAMGAEPVLTLCCAPDWMKGGKAGSTDWSRVHKPPTPDHFDDFARLAQVAAARYPEVRRFLVWNEMKGFYDEDRNRWDTETYTDLYNRVYEAVKEVRPDALVGGPYVVFDTWSSLETASHPSAISGDWGVVDQRALDAVDEWLDRAVGADFIAIDASSGTRDRGLITSDFAATEALGAVTRWVRSRTDLPVWWAEIYATCGDPSATSADPRRAAVMAEALVTVAQAGASGALLWQPQASDDVRTAALFTDTDDPRGGRPLPLATLLSALSEQLREDPRRVVSTWHPSHSVWTLYTPDWEVWWSPEEGLQGPFARGAL